MKWMELLEFFFYRNLGSLNFSRAECGGPYTHWLVFLREIWTPRPLPFLPSPELRCIVCFEVERSHKERVEHRVAAWLTRNPKSFMFLLAEEQLHKWDKVSLMRYKSRGLAGPCPKYPIKPQIYLLQTSYICRQRWFSSRCDTASELIFRAFLVSGVPA
ncbi:hypothetical protein R1flu_003021 [Riccia fluitans]|uniref:Maturase K n=1 Tax=Riccia fluitans TaxID=41844 RepID=A0ABD1Y856_9MARC